MIEKKYPHLFSPFKVRNFIFKNRIVSAPVGAWVFSPRNFIFDYAISMFEAKALGGAAAVTVGHTEVNAEEDDTDGFGLYFNLKNRQGIAALAEFAQAIQNHGSHASVQLNYGGNYGPSEVTPEFGPPTLAMTEAKIMKTVDQFVESAKRLKQAGFDMCQIHGGHGWLLMSFLNPETNRRTDRYGGSLENRMRFPLMVVNAVRDAVGKNMMIEYRLSGYDPDTAPVLFEETVTFVKAIENEVDLVHVSAGTRGDPSVRVGTFPTYLEPRGKNAPLAAALKKRVNIPIITVGAITEPETAEQIIAEGKADFVAMARALIADPELPNKARHGQEEDIIPCVNCYKCLDNMHHYHAVICSVNPRSGREHRVGEIVPAKISRKVTVVGGGPAGMQAAITAAERGHQVTLYEKSDALGGILKITDNDPLKNLLKRYKNYLIRQVAKHDVTVKLNTEATPALVEAGKPDAIIVAAGSRHFIPDIPGVKGKNVITAIDAHQLAAMLGKRVVVIGGNLGGCETALYLQTLHKEVTVVEMAKTLLTDTNMEIRGGIYTHLDKKTRCLTSARCTKITDQGIYVTYQDGNMEMIPADTVILVVGMQANDDVYKSMLDCAVDVIPVGDCVKPATVLEASRTAYFAALDI
jgi:2,4-dienoyl-CoA reductase-like NADH-dependent reductase (Old Yellow Enzyme family)/thioredoxin reductase